MGLFDRGREAQEPETLWRVSITSGAGMLINFTSGVAQCAICARCSPARMQPTAPRAPKCESTTSKYRNHHPFCPRSFPTTTRPTPTATLWTSCVQWRRGMKSIGSNIVFANRPELPNSHTPGQHCNICKTSSGPRTTKEARDRQRHIESSRAMWSRFTVIDDDVASIDSHDGQVDAQNRMIDREIERLSQILPNGLNELPLPIATILPPASEDIPAYQVSDAAHRELETIDHSDDDDKERFRVAYMPDSRQLVIECELPDVNVVPKVKQYRYVKNRNEITKTVRPQSQIKAIYADSIAQSTLLYIAAAFATDEHEAIDVIAFNGIVDTIDRRSGQRIRPCLITVRVSREKFASLNLEHVDPQACLKHLSAGVSELSAGRARACASPVLEFEMVDPRFVAESDAMQSATSTSGRTSWS